MPAPSLTCCPHWTPGRLDAWTDDTHVVLADLGYHGEADRLVCPIEKPATLTVAERAVTSCTPPPERWPNAVTRLLETTFKALRRVSFCPGWIGAVNGAALVLLHIEHGRTT